MASDNHRWLPMHTDGCRWLVTTTDGCRWPADVHRCLLMTTNENWWCECLLILRLKFCLSIPRCALMHRCFDVISQIPCFWLQDTPKFLLTVDSELVIYFAGKPNNTINKYCWFNILGKKYQNETKHWPHQSLASFKNNSNFVRHIWETDK